jgi:hypothetical protein
VSNRKTLQKKKDASHWSKGTQHAGQERLTDGERLARGAPVLREHDERLSAVVQISLGLEYGGVLEVIDQLCWILQALYRQEGEKRTESALRGNLGS